MNLKYKSTKLIFTHFYKSLRGCSTTWHWSCLLYTSDAADEEDIVAIDDLQDALLETKVGKRDADQLREDVELIEGVYGALDAKDYLSAKVAPVFFGSAVNNFGVKEMLDTFIRIAPVPRSRATSKRLVEVGEDKFSGFIFKIHANLDPKHRDLSLIHI